MIQRPFDAWSLLRQPHRPRLLIEDPDPALQVSEFRLFEDAGFDVALCSGPGGRSDCPLVAGEDCELVESADVVLMGPGMADHRDEVAAAIHHHRPEMPVVVQIPRADPGQCPSGCVAEYVPASINGQIRALWRALDGQPAPSPAATPPPSRAQSSTTARLIDLLGW